MSEVIFIAFFDNERLIRRELVPNGQTVNRGFDIEVFIHLSRKNWETVGSRTKTIYAPCYISFA